MANDPYQILARLSSGENLLIFIDKAALTKDDAARLAGKTREKKFDSVIVLTNGEASEFVKLAKEQTDAAN